MERRTHHEAQRQISSTALEERFGVSFLRKGIVEKTDVLPFVQIQNQLRPTEDTPDRANHSVSWTFSPLRNDKYNIAYVSLRDRFILPGGDKEHKRIEKAIMAELEQIPDGFRKSKVKPVLLNHLSGLLQEKHPGWDMDTQYSIDMDQQHSFTVDLEKWFGKTRARVMLDVYGICVITIRMPILPGFEVVSSEVREVVKEMSLWLGLPYSPSLKYEFSMAENGADSDPSGNCETFPKYFFRVLEYWKSLSGERSLRALVGKSRSGEPILLMEDPTLSVASGRVGVNLDLICYGIGNSESGLIVSTHPDIFEAFGRGISDRRVNSSLAVEFTGGDFNDRNWLHMFIQLDSNNNATLVEDVGSNGGKEHLKETLKQVEKQYGISYGGLIDKESAEIEARRPMFMPIINEQVAVLQHNYDSKTAKAFRGVAISALIYGSKHAHDKYLEYLKLI